MRISLDGEWQFKDYYGEDWRWRNAHKANTTDIRHWHKGRVPGSVHDDLWNAGEIPNPYFERNSLLIEWIPARTWLYKRAFTVDSALQGKRVHLIFEGVDYSAEFFLNGESLGRHVGMYTPAEFDVTTLLNYGGENVLAVVIDPAPHEQPQVSRTSHVRVHKSRMTYWWDFCPRMIHVGIWDSVWLDVSDTTRITDVWVRPQLNDDLTRADVQVNIQLETTEEVETDLDIDLLLDGQVVGSVHVNMTFNAGKHSPAFTIPVENPALWYPNGYGPHPLYTAVISPYRREVRFGMHRVEFVANETDDATALPYTMVVNGLRIYAKGWNWVPMDVMYGVPRPEKLAHLLGLAQNAHVNLLRIWGGGLIEREDFYNHCDELGIMVWQEFIQSSSGIENTPSDAPEFIALMTAEAEQIIPRKRNHPSLVIWCGGNELTGENNAPLDNRHPLLNALKKVVEWLDPNRYWLPTSPTGRLFGNTMENIALDPSGLHDVHGPWEYQGVKKQYDLYNRSTSLLHSEFGVEGVTNLKTLNATIAPQNQSPATLDNPLWQHLGAWWNQQKTWRAVYGGDIPHIPTLIRATQWLQAEGLRYAVEADMRRMYQNSGTLPWQFNEPYPMATCTSAVDYYGQPKPSYYAVANAYRPAHVSARFDAAAWDGAFAAEIWGHNTSHAAIHDVRLTVQLVGFDGQVYSEKTQTVTLAPNRAVSLMTFEAIPQSENVFFLDITLTDTQNAPLATNRYAFAVGTDLSAFLNLPTTTLDVQYQDDSVIITNTGNQTAFYIWLEDTRPAGAAGYVTFDRNYLILFPQESTTVRGHWQGVAEAERELSLAAWNSAIFLAR